MELTYEEVSKATIPSLLLKRVEESPKSTAFRYKDLGIYKEVIWEKYWDQVEAFAFGLLELGVEVGDRVAIMGDPCPEYLYADLAVLCVRAICYGIYSTSSIPEVEYVMKTGGAKLFIAEDQEYVDKILPSASVLSNLSKIIVIDNRATFMYRDPRLVSFEDVQELGRRRKAKSPQQLSELIKQGNPHDVSFLVFTSGTAGPPKPAMISHHNILTAMVWATGEIFPDIRVHEHRSISHLSLAHIMERGMTIYCPLVHKVVPYIGESLQYMQETLYEVQPTFIHGVPRIWEKIAAQAIVGIESSSWIKRLAYSWAMRLGQKRIQRAGETPSLRYRISRWIAVQIAFRHILHRLGLGKVKYAYSAGAPLSAENQALWQTWGMDLVNSYGATETGGTICSERPGSSTRRSKPGNVGTPTSVMKFYLAEDGEVIVSGPGIFLGYWNNEEETRETIKDGCLHTGDVGEYTEDGGLRLVDRKKDIMITSGGKNITPSLLETALKASPYISEAVIFADGRKFPSALIEIDFETVSEWARRNKVLYTGFTSLSNHPKVYELIGEEVEKSNRDFGRVEQVKMFRIIPKELDPEEGDTTATRKIKRKRMYEMFHDLVEEMYTSKKR